MAKDRRFKTVGFLIQAGHIKTFNDIFLHIPKSVVYTTMGWNFNRFNRLVKSPQLFTISDLIILASLFEVEPDKVIDLVLAQADKKKRK